jgi:hypothetical protein
LFALLAQASEPVTSVTSQIQFDAFVVSAILSVIIPVLTGLLTKVTAAPAVKQVVTIVLAAVASLLATNTVQDGTAVISKETGMLWAMNLAIAITSYLGIYKPHDLDAKANPEFGIG